MAPFKGAFVTVDHFVDIVQLSVGDRITVRTYF